MNNLNRSNKNKQPISLTLRMIVFVAVTISLCLFTINVVVLNVVEHHFKEQDADELTVMNQSIFQHLHKLSASKVNQGAMLSQAVSGHHGVYFQIRNALGDIIYSSPELSFSTSLSTILSNSVSNPLSDAGSNKSLNNSPIVELDALQLWESNGHTFRGAVTPYAIGSDSFIIITAIDMEFHKTFLQSFRRSLALVMVLAGIATLLAVWFGVFQGLAPLRRLSHKVKSIEADQLDFRLDIKSVPKELTGLVLAFNQMINGLEKSFKQLSHFSADIAHELRTPLTNIITQTQVGLSKPRDIEEYKNLLYSNLEEQERLAKMVNDMLWLAKSDHGLVKPVLENIDLRQEISDLFEFFEALAEEQNIELVLEGNPLFIQGDRSMLRQAFSNLLSNALRHTQSGKTIKVSIGNTHTHPHTHALISFENAGEHIAQEHLEKLFDRFYRVDPARQRNSDGAGLGLSIVKSIIESHKGYTEVTSSSGMIQFMIYLPLVNSAHH